MTQEGARLTNRHCRVLDWNSDVGILTPNTSGRDLTGSRAFTEGIK